MNSDIYRKLVDLYAGHDLPSELEDEMEWAAFADQELSHEMGTLRRTYELLHADEAPVFTEESRQRILMKLFARGANFETASPEPSHLQLGLPIAG